VVVVVVMLPFLEQVRTFLLLRLPVYPGWEVSAQLDAAGSPRTRKCLECRRTLRSKRDERGLRAGRKMTASRPTLTRAETDTGAAEADGTRAVVVDDLGDEHLGVGVVGADALLLWLSRVDQTRVTLAGDLVAGVEPRTAAGLGASVEMGRVGASGEVAGSGVCGIGGDERCEEERENGARETH
jgi:hypothetical protein